MFLSLYPPPHCLLKLQREVFVVVVHSQESQVIGLFTFHSKPPCIQAFALGTRLSLTTQETDWSKDFAQTLVHVPSWERALVAGIWGSQGESLAPTIPWLDTCFYLLRFIFAVWETKSLWIVCLKAGSQGGPSWLLCKSILDILKKGKQGAGSDSSSLNEVTRWNLGEQCCGN